MLKYYIYFIILEVAILAGGLYFGGYGLVKTVEYEHNLSLLEEYNNVEMLFYEEPFISEKGSAYGRWGGYFPFPPIIQAVTDGTLSLKVIICHELMHHYWRYYMPKEEKKYWKERFNNINDMAEEQRIIWTDADEYFAYNNEIRWEKCYKKE